MTIEERLTVAETRILSLQADIILLRSQLQQLAEAAAAPR